MNKADIIKNRVYCTNCKYYYCLSRIYLISQNPHQCGSPLNLVKEYRFDGVHLKMRKYADELNKNCDCLNYRKSWYKFWVREE